MLTGLMIEYYPVGIYLLKVNNRNTRTRCEICRSFVNFSKALFKNFFRGVFIGNFGHFQHLDPLFLLLTLNILPTGT